ncbi:flagellar export protein FliJ [Bacillus alkalicellulosilyticus]|uniref:flagellar export protein FliJ n=1 Tax=Alkalihalobacterium alkalicellulosilyticum TaxID=1912214 RepID=UPI00099735C7|nr:flagellar export protein FliJ [Bacillus alkalicellulosilyticus]
MSFRYTLQKVLEIKEKDKQEKQQMYITATQTFEETATQLYNLLKRKEEIESDYRTKLEKGIVVFELQRHQSVMSGLQRNIEEQQFKTNVAREQMVQTQDVLTKSSIDVKTFEIMKERKYEQYLFEEKAKENQFMDEISVQLYVNRNKVRA